MAKPRSKRKSNKAYKPNIKEVVEVTEAASIYVGIWTKQETSRLLKSEPLIIPTNWGFRIGKYSVKTENSTWFVSDEWGEIINYFTSKKSAVYWCLLQVTNRLNQSRNLMEQDFKLGKYTQDQVNYQYSRKRAITRGDYLSVDILNARLSENQSLLEEARNDLEKTLTSAKYLKGIWEKPL